MARKCVRNPSQEGLIVDEKIAKKIIDDIRYSLVLPFFAGNDSLDLQSTIFLPYILVLSSSLACLLFLVFTFSEDDMTVLWFDEGYTPKDK